LPRKNWDWNPKTAIKIRSAFGLVKCSFSGGSDGGVCLSYLLMQTIQNMNQKQREALVDLLLLGMFAGGSLKVSDDQKLLSVIDEIGWESYQTPDLYFQSAIAKARDAADTEARTLARLKKINDGLANDEIRHQAIERLERFLSLHGEPGVEESKFLELAKTSLHGEQVA
jgi:hypothetical protein